ncbi:unnamed protein product [Phytophthora fragariaefolia]|uniref:Unnamed protein product n=1 Tax=Phytophthora fragariaefolia TaxID=1490495 RepID=A0A9W6X5E6_9STRA|nr:unnamed protein product [Phytophthora fragariaefolia]
MIPVNTNGESVPDAQDADVLLPPATSMNDVHAAWLAAGARGDVAGLRQLRVQFPAWLDLHRNGKTPLHYCVEEGGLLVTHLLLGHGAGINVEDSDGATPLKRVIQRADLNVLLLFFNHHELVATPQGQDFSTSVLFQAVEYEMEEVVRFVVDNEYAPVTVRNAAGETPLHRAIIRRSPSVMEMLADLDLEGDSLTAVTVKMETPAHYAARHGSAREVEVLLLCLTRVFGDLEELVELGAANPLNIGDEKGMTSLYVASTTTVSAGRAVVGVGTSEGEADARSVEVRDAKVRLLLNHGGRIFPPGFLVQTLSASVSCTPHVVLPVLVQHCLRVWVVGTRTDTAQPEDDAEVSNDRGNSMIEALTDLCMHWIGYVACPGIPMTLVAVVTCAGYAHEVLPLLLSLPLRRAAFRLMLSCLMKLTTRNASGHTLLPRLHDELSEAWHDINST